MPYSEAFLFSFLAAVFDIAAAVAKLIFTPAVFGKVPEIGECGIGNIRECFFGKECLMGGDDDVRHRNQARENIIRNNMSGEVLKEDIRLLLVDIQTSGTDNTGFDAIEECFRVNQCTA